VLLPRLRLTGFSFWHVRDFLLKDIQPARLFFANISVVYCSEFVNFRGLCAGVILCRIGRGEMMNNAAYAPVCGTYCGACQYLGQQCPGCGNVYGQPFWTAQMPNGICPIHDCCRKQRQLEHCGTCDAFPCKTFSELRDPSMSDEKFLESLNTRKTNTHSR